MNTVTAVNLNWNSGNISVCYLFCLSGLEVLAGLTAVQLQWSWWHWTDLSYLHAIIYKPQIAIPHNHVRIILREERVLSPVTGGEAVIAVWSWFIFFLVTFNFFFPILFFMHLFFPLFIFCGSAIAPHDKLNRKFASAFSLQKKKNQKTRESRIFANAFGLFLHGRREDGGRMGGFSRSRSLVLHHRLTRFAS